MRISSRTFRTPMWAAPRAPPPPSASPIRGRGCGAGASCAAAERGRSPRSRQRPAARRAPEKVIGAGCYRRLTRLLLLRRLLLLLTLEHLLHRLALLGRQVFHLGLHLLHRVPVLLGLIGRHHRLHHRPDLAVPRRDL